MITFKKKFLTFVLMLFCGMVSHAADDDLITDQVTVKLNTAGTLLDKIGSTKKYKITNLKVIGKINGTDLQLIRDMVGRRYNDYYYGKTSGKLSILDLGQAKIVEGGEDYFCFSNYHDCDYKYFTENNVLGAYAFYDCGQLTSLTLPSSITSIDDRAFEGCIGLTSLKIPSKVNSIGDCAFKGCTGLTSLKLPDNVTTISMGLFEGCTGLKSFSIAKSKIGYGAFMGCTGLTSLTLFSCVEEIGDCAFKGCTGLTSLKLPYGLKTIGSRSFEGCTGLTWMEIPSSVTEIPSEAFKNCIGLTKLTIPSSVTKINFNAFKGCTNLTNMTITFARCSIDPSAFSECNLKEVRYYLGNVVFWSYLSIGHDYISDAETKYFDSNQEITQWEIPSSVTKIGPYAVSGCKSLTSLTIPSSVTEIGVGAFKGCTNLSSITIPASVIEINPYTFAGCTSLTSLTIPSSVKYISYDAFRNCTSLTSLTIPSSVKNIGEDAFKNCSGLTSIYVYAQKVPYTYSDVFTGCDAKNCTVYVPKGTYFSYKFSKFGYFENIVEFDPTGIKDVTTSADTKEVSRYSVNGQRLSAPSKGLNIVKYNDGSVKKVVVQ